MAEKCLKSRQIWSTKQKIVHYHEIQSKYGEKVKNSSSMKE